MGFFTTTEEPLSETGIYTENNNYTINSNKLFSHNIFYEDIIDEMNNDNKDILRNLLNNLVKEHKSIIIKGLNSNQRYQIYNQCYYPLKFEKIIEKENVKEIESGNNQEYIYKNILIYNYKIKKDINKDIDKEFETEENYKSENESDLSFITNDESQIERLENLSSQQLEMMGRTERKIDKCINKLRFLFLLNAFSWLVLFMIDPVRVDIVKKVECY